MRYALAFLATWMLLACETEPLGGRCTNDFDCDRNTVSTSRIASCRQAIRPELECAGGDNCICCLIIPEPGVDGGGQPSQCQGSGGVGVDASFVDTVPDGNDGSFLSDSLPESSTDATGMDAPGLVDVGPEASGMDSSLTCSTLGTSCPTGTFCNGSTCVPWLGLGATCGGDDQCDTDHCADGVCCNSACVTPGMSCVATPDLTGLCSPIPKPADSGSGTSDAASE